MDNKKVLIVEDDAVSRLLLSEAINQMNEFEVFEAENGKLALDLFHQYTFDIILLDINLPDFSGFDICSYIRQARHGNDTPVVMITSMDDRESIESAYNYGATDFIVKPINWSLFGYRLRYILRSRRDYLALKESEKRLEYAQEIARLGHWELDTEKDQLRFSMNLCKMIGIPGTSYEHGIQYFVDLVHTSDRHNFHFLLDNTLNKNEPFRLETRIQINEHKTLFVVIQGRLERDGSTKVVGTLQDISVQKLSQERLTHIAHHDALTDLPNRTLFHRLMEGSIQRSQRSGLKVALLFIDLDRFKNINDSLGHHVGDELLIQVASRLKNAVRAYDSVARLGGDEFAILLDSVESAHDITALTHRILEEFNTPFNVLEYSLHVKASIGISVYPDDGKTHDKLLRNADTAMYQAKSSVDEKLKFYSSELTQETIRNWSMENELREALDNDNFYLHYQPKMCSISDQVIGVEALIRWDRGDKEQIPPSEFIPVAEMAGMLVPIGKWVISTAIKQLASWQDTVCSELTIAVNVSASQLNSDDFCDFIESELKKYSVKPELFEIEITEDSLIASEPNDGGFQQALTTLRELGIRMAIDDFGTGYSSLGQLKLLPISQLKIDKSFVDCIPEQEKDVAIIRSIVDFARNLGLEVIAEGVETEEQLTSLKHYGCDQIQGFVNYKPMSADAIEEIMNTSREN
ncbi:EAL domain-containing protein [Vibrio sp. HN007]|uniref:two-component system response regulator n=1 Tax=Vibrio iocasae TaxID=3098914 RepID=UPI0035D4F3A0